MEEIARGFMLELHRNGHITLPAKRQTTNNPFLNRKKPDRPDIDQTLVTTDLKAIKPLEIVLVKNTPREPLFNSLIEHHHYLGYCHPVGEQLKYMVFAGDRPLACFSWSPAPRHIGVRDRYIGWKKEHRDHNLCYIAYNSRFLILSWFRVPHLASWLLRYMAKNLSRDWERVYCHPVYCLETFVDTALFAGTCYKAANWQYLGDTTMKILSLMKENKDRTTEHRTGIFTTGIISRIDDDKKIALFYTGRNHAGENITGLYRKRGAHSLPPIQMCYALSRNTTDEFKGILCNCLTHARRNFVGEIENFPEETTHVIDVFAEVYRIDAQAKKEKMTPDQRLTCHKEHSKPLMTGLKSRLAGQTEENLVEPNSGLGKAIAYMLKHWEKLTQFLRVPGAPLDNNICEQSLKRCIQHRKNSLFYRTEHGACIGDLFMSLIHTCTLLRVNPLDYLITLLKNTPALFKDPSKWMPWNYKANAT